MIQRFEECEVWKKSISYAKDIYRTFNSTRDYGFLDQIHRAVISISNNMAEGFERRSNNEFKQFLYIAKGSCGEVRSMLYLAIVLGMITKEQGNQLIEQSEEISKMLMGLIKSL